LSNGVETGYQQKIISVSFITNMVSFVSHAISAIPFVCKQLPPYGLRDFAMMKAPQPPTNFILFKTAFNVSLLPSNRTFSA
jgi:hypothetical protein